MGQGSQAAQGAVGGALTGATIGSVGGPMGTAVGAGVGAIAGGVAGWFGGGDEKDEYQRKLEELAAHYANMSAPELGQAAQGVQSQLVSNRAALISQLEAQARGEGPSAAAQMMQRGADSAVRGMTAQASGAGGRGVNAGAAMREAQNAGVGMQMQNLQNTGIIRSQEQLNAQGQLGQNISQGISSDNQMSQFNAGQNNQFAMQQALLEMQQRGLASGTSMQSLQMGAGMAQPGMGTSLLAAGANSVPQLMQMYTANQQQERMRQMQEATGQGQEPGGFNDYSDVSEPNPALNQRVGRSPMY